MCEAALAHTQGCHIKKRNKWCIKKSAKPSKLKQDSFEICLEINETVVIIFQSLFVIFPW